MFFVQKGVAAVISRNDEVLRLLHSGSPIGHIGLLKVRLRWIRRLRGWIQAQRGWIRRQRGRGEWPELYQ
eukprot:1176030-Prorocentrum_minimum.AAC.5